MLFRGLSIAAVKECSHTNHVMKLINNYNDECETITLNGNKLTISNIHSMFTGKFQSASLTDDAKEAIKNSHKYLHEKISQGACIYGINTGFGGSAQVRYKNDMAVNSTLVNHLKAGFGQQLPSSLVKATMLIRVNSIAFGFSGVHEKVVNLLLALLNQDIVPCIPKRGSISASGDLMPLSYIAACLEGRESCKVFAKGVKTTASEALKAAGLEPVIFTGKDALGVMNASSFAAALAAEVLYRGNIAILLTQAVVAMCVEALGGRLESFQPVIHEKCLPHIGQQEVASNILKFLQNTNMAISQPEIERGFREGELRQDRYGMRTSPQWLAPVLETAIESIRRIDIELNSANDNPIINCKKGEILHCGNFQSNSITVAMDQFRQCLQLCGKLLFALMSEIVDSNINNCLSPNLCGGDPNVDMGFKGTEVAMAAYTSELDFLNAPVSNHVLIAEIRNQSINSLALISARMSEDALEIFQMQLINILRALVQAVELRWLKKKVESIVSELMPKSSVCVEKKVMFQVVPWFLFFSCSSKAIDQVMKLLPGSNVAELKNGFHIALDKEMEVLRNGLKSGAFINKISRQMGQGRLFLQFHVVAMICYLFSSFV